MDLRTYLKTTSTTQAAFAEKLHVSQGTVAHWLCNRVRVPAERLLDIEQATDGQVTAQEMRQDLAPLFCPRAPGGAPLPPLGCLPGT
ncbi:YdaS family helix-turn-helix protein [uncultured Thiodictyon sp.]|uniref:transcriptional regulator n=1 Tax=uncultured Thiodictyon sp. TaxID=1846217 RepID=UPI0025F4DB16|nr:YdaS family helix-turn-helix protein [uncultured Thiodictyon sp.]